MVSYRATYLTGISGEAFEPNVKRTTLGHLSGNNLIPTSKPGFLLGKTCHKYSLSPGYFERGTRWVVFTGRFRGFHESRGKRSSHYSPGIETPGDN